MSNGTQKEIEGVNESTYAGKAVKACRLKARGVVGDELVSFKMVDFVSLMLLNNKFAANGIFITDTNKEECYIKIIELGDESLINDLEKFITLKDEIKVIEGKQQEYLTIVGKLKALSDYNNESAVNGIVEEYLRR
jgi:hypothetical protein